MIQSSKSLPTHNAMDFLTIDQVCLFHDDAIMMYGGSVGIRDLGLLESALAQPQMVLFGEPLCKDVYEVAAAYCFHIIKNHPFIDGNKRTGMLAA